jgi:hypothetical protein
VDVDGRYDYSLVRRVFIQDPGEVVIGPNPATSRLFLRFTRGGVEERRIQVISSDGAVKLNRVYPSSEVELSLKGLPAGTYYVRILTKNGIIFRPFVCVGD